MAVATLANGCFWCTEAVFRRLRGVNSVMPGYAGDGEPNPKYYDVAMGMTPYAESLQIEFDPEVISYEKLLDVFFASHDPTTLNRQGADTGPQYRSAIFYHDEKQKESAEKAIKEQDLSGKFPSKIVTAVEPFTKFYPAEQEHKDFYERNRNNAYCRFIIDPKVTKLYKDFKEDVKIDP